jgi:hypothetical protein
MNRAEVDHRLRRWAGAKSLPPEHLRRWLALNERSRATLLEIAENLKMHTGQFIAGLVLLEEIATREGSDVAEVLTRSSIRRVITSGGSGPGRARALLDELRGLRYPRLKQADEQLARELATIKLPAGIKVVLPRELASDEVRIEIVARGSAEMERLLGCLMVKAAELTRLAAMLGGIDAE